MRGDSGYAYLPTGQAEIEFAKYEKRIRELTGQIERMKPIVEAAVEWRRIGYERKDEFSYRIGPLLDAIDIYDTGAKRPCEELK